MNELNKEYDSYYFTGAKTKTSSFFNLQTANGKRRKNISPRPHCAGGI